MERLVVRHYRHATGALPRFPATPDGDYARRVLLPLMQQGTRAFIANVQAAVEIVVMGDTVLPLIVADAVRRRHSGQAYVCSMLTHYIDYAQREVELELARQPTLRRTAPLLLESLRPLLLAGNVDQCVYVNNWLLSTNLYPPLDASMLDALHAALVQAFPQHSIVFRSLNVAMHADLLAALRQRGYLPLLSRQVYLLDPRDGVYLRRRDTRNDMRLARRTPYRWRSHATLHPADSPRLRALYDDLYLSKYSHHNPQFTTRFVRTAMQQQWLTLAALEQHGRLDGVLGYIERHGIITAPLVGYDRRVPPDAGLYRLLGLHLTHAAAERGCLLHASSGAAAFKRSRGCTPALEYSMIYAQHLPPMRQLVWRLLAGLLEKVVVPLMQAHQL